MENRKLCSINKHTLSVSFVYFICFANMKKTELKMLYSKIYKVYKHKCLYWLVLERILFLFLIDNLNGITPALVST